MRDQSKGLKSRIAARDEKGQMQEDRQLLAELELANVAYDWEKDVLEEVSRRLYHEQRALFEHQRRSAREIIGRRRGRPGPPRIADDE